MHALSSTRQRNQFLFTVWRRLHSVLINFPLHHRNLWFKWWRFTCIVCHSSPAYPVGSQCESPRSIFATFPGSIADKTESRSKYLLKIGSPFTSPGDFVFSVMAPSKMRRALGAVKDQTSIGLAKVGSSNSLSDLDVAIVKATRHEEYPADERYIREILSLTSYSRAYISACVNTLSRRLNKTRNWTVALKTLILIQRLLAEGDPAYEQEIFFATRRGTRLLNLSDFRDSRSDSWDYSAFVRTFALYLDERLEFRMQGRRGKRSAFGMEEDEEEAGQASVRSTPVRDMKIEHIFSRIQHLQQLLERFLACRPTGGARHNRVVIVTLYSTVKESIQLYYDITEIMGTLIDRFMELEIPDAVKVHEIFCRVSTQLDELDNFYSWCKTVGIARTSEYPDIEKITQKKLDLMEEFIQDKSALAQTKIATISEEPKKEADEEKQCEDDMNAMKALPPPENYTETPVGEVQEEEAKEEEKKEISTQQEADFLNLYDDAVSTEEHANKMALALFDGDAPAGPAQAPAWEAFSDETADWETALVQSASNLTKQKVTLAGGLNMMLLEGMYQHGVKTAEMSATGYGVHGSASSVALGSAGRPAMLALPAPPGPNSSATTPANPDPFAASLAVAPPPYVQMSEMEKKQKLLVEEQLLWQQYAKNGMQGQAAYAKLQPNSYNVGGYSQGYYPRSG